MKRIDKRITSNGITEYVYACKDKSESTRAVFSEKFGQGSMYKRGGYDAHYNAYTVVVGYKRG